MLGKILKIEDKIIKVENLKKISLIDIIGFYVVFESKKQLVGEIEFVNELEFHIRLIGEIRNKMFIPGTENYPSIDSKCRVVYKEELEYIIGSQDVFVPDNLLLGKSTIYDGFNISVKVNDLFSSHLAIVGNTGAGKSCCVARLIQNLFAENKPNPKNAQIIMFDAYGEYISALTKINEHQNINVKILSQNLYETGNIERIKIPPYLLDADDLAILLNVDDQTLVPVLEKTLTYVYIFKSQDDICMKYKNDIIAKALYDILSSGRSAQQIRDQALAFLAKYNTNELNLDTVVVQPGYNRTIKQCLNIDTQGKLQALEILMAHLKQYSELSVDQIETKPTVYTLDDIYYALEFAIVSEGAILSETIFEKMNRLKTSLNSIINSDLKAIFDYKGNFDRNGYVKNLFLTPTNEFVQFIDVDFNGIDDRFAKIIIKIMSKIFYKFSTSLPERGSFPINIMVEEAHRYIQNDNDINVIGYNVFDRIAKEGRKYGLILSLITQRLSELSSNTLSQCSNFIVFRMFYPDDIKVITSISSNISLNHVEKVKSLRPGSALLFGNAFKIPLITQFDIPDPMPKSTSVDIVNRWYGEQ